MILMLVKGESVLGKELADALSPYGISIVHYQNPIKAMDNMAETNPRIILYSLQDFPRHWKIMIKFLREDSHRDQTIFLLLAEKKPDLEEANKALFLGVNGILTYGGQPRDLARQIREIFLRYGAFDIPEGKAYLTGGLEHPMGFLFRHPRKKHLITGVLVHLEENWATFRPDFRQEIADLEPDDRLKACSLRLDDSLITLNAKVVKNTGQLHLEIEPVKKSEEEVLRAKLQNIEG